MGLLEIASGKSVWRGYDYYQDEMVVSRRQDGNCLSGQVRGSNNNVYDVMIDLDHPKRSTCTCPHAEGSRRVCKHKVALYFEQFPEEADRFIREVEEYEAEEEKREQERYEEIHKYVYSLKKQELRDELLQLLIELDGKNYWW